MNTARFGLFFEGTVSIGSIFPKWDEGVGDPNENWGRTNVEE